MSRMNRRDFLKRSAAAAALAGLYALPVRADSKSPNEKLNLAFVGVGHKGRDNLDHLTSENVVALCDVDAGFLGAAAKDFPKAAQYRDYRKMFDAEAKNVDAVVVSTADHSHAVATARALTLGKHVYCEKPLTHTVKEARTMAQLAAKHKCVTQMGTQIHAEDNYRRVVEIIQAGGIGPVKQVYNWCNKGWSDGRFKVSDKPPANLEWELWLGPAKERSFCEGIHPENWRKFWEYGSGTFGDMAAHIMDLPFWALGLRHPTTVEATGPEVHPDGAPAYCLAKYTFAAQGDRPALDFFWSDGGKHHDLVKDTKDYKGDSLSKWGLGILFVGEKGMLAADYGRHELYPRDKFEGYKPPAQTIAKSLGHWKEWAEACKTNGPTTCTFDYSGALTENILLGVVAFRSGKKLEWDPKQLTTGSKEADALLTKEYRQGFDVPGLV
jgi:predicted dehydrogenase